ncbi:MAG: lipoate--protein ligase family protein [Candidatus Synoicihabitans palmerolidicus]|nr:lipoate--protein ligase family protein [Candidatus Synoicihabitans palmerolidicus]
MSFDLLPFRCDSAATNMATDFLLLQHYLHPTHARFRHYDWQRPAITFGYSQKVAWVREQTSTIDPVPEYCRRPTGGGIVDHREDWTYALVIPRGHPLFDARAVASYEAIHRVLADGLQTLNCPAVIKTTCEPSPDCTPGSGVCFDRAELYDVVHAHTAAKIAGAAQNRAKRGLLFQGSIARPIVGDIDWSAFEAAFTTRLAHLLDFPLQTPGWPGTWDDAIDTLAENYATPQWIERR